MGKISAKLMKIVGKSDKDNLILVDENEKLWSIPTKFIFGSKKKDTLVLISEHDLHDKLPFGSTKALVADEISLDRRVK